MVYFYLKFNGVHLVSAVTASTALSGLATVMRKGNFFEAHAKLKM